MATDSAPPLAVITGASSGIGLELARQFAEHGVDLLVAVKDAGISSAAAELRSSGRRVTDVQVDLGDPAGVELLYERIRDQHRTVDAIAINAGIGISGDFARETTFSDNMAVIDLNVRSSVHLAKLVLPDMVEQGEGRVLFTSSIATTMPGPYDAVYNASKLFLQSFSQAGREELKDTGVTVTALVPGPTETDVFARAGMQDTAIGQAEKDDPADVAREGYEAFMAGKDHVIAGSMKNRMQATMAHVLPDTTAAGMHAKQSKPGSGRSK